MELYLTTQKLAISNNIYAEKFKYDHNPSQLFYSYIPLDQLYLSLLLVSGCSQLGKQRRLMFAILQPNDRPDSMLQANQVFIRVHVFMKIIQDRLIQYV